MALAALTLGTELPGLHAAYPPMADGSQARDPGTLLACVLLGLALFIETQRRLVTAIGLLA
ncbi:hypothetical protein LP419_17235 [Massilia sp. H-1]|nr:hypothetical protein LP419_17235 [Massilia sp. H-1]